MIGKDSRVFLLAFRWHCFLVAFLATKVWRLGVVLDRTFLQSGCY